jgi:hypothetical protein
MLENELHEKRVYELGSSDNEVILRLLVAVFLKKIF